MTSRKQLEKDFHDAADTYNFHRGYDDLSAAEYAGLACDLAVELCDTTDDEKEIKRWSANAAMWQRSNSSAMVAHLDDQEEKAER